MQRTAYGHALLPTSQVSKPHFSPPPENAVWKRDQSVGARDYYIINGLVDRMAAEDSAATL